MNLWVPALGRQSRPRIMHSSQLRSNCYKDMDLLRWRTKQCPSTALQSKTTHGAVSKITHGAVSNRPSKRVVHKMQRASKRLVHKMQTAASKLVRQEKQARVERYHKRLRKSRRTLKV